MLSLIVLQGPGKGRVFRFAGDKPVVLGRQSGDLRLLDPKISRRHAEINLEGGTWVIRDLKSANGTFVNDRRISQLTELEEGDQLAFGPFVLVVGQLSSEPPTMEDTSLVDVDSMDHVMLSPHIPTTDRVQQEDDVMHVEPLPHDARPDAPSAEASEEPSGASIFDVEDEELPVTAADDDEPDMGLDDLEQLLDADDNNAESDKKDESAAVAMDDEQAAQPEVPYNLLGSLEADSFESFEDLDDEAADEQLSADVSDDVEAAADLDAADVEDSVEAEVADLSEPEPSVVHDAEPVVEAEDEEPAEAVVASAHAQTPISDEDDDLEPPRTLGEAKRKPRILWPLTLAVVFLAVSGGSGWFFYTTGKPRDLNPTATAQREAQTQKTDESASADAVAEPMLPPAAAPRPAVKRDEPVSTVTMSMLDDGPALFGSDEPEAPAPKTLESQPQPEPQPESTEPAPQVTEEPKPAPQPEPAQEPIPEPVKTQVVETPPAVEPPAPVAVAPIKPAPAAAPEAAPAVDVLPFDQKRVVYLVDASGSLLDTLPQVLIWLDDSIRRIEPDLHYTVIFFRAGEAVEVPPVGLKDAGDRDVNRDVRRWIAWDAGNVIPAGRSDPRAAINQALGYGVGQIYILSDGHVGDRLSDEQIADFMVGMNDAVGSHKLSVHSIQFFYPEMHGLLAHLSRRFPGERQYIEPVKPKGDAFDGLSAVPN